MGLGLSRSRPKDKQVRFKNQKDDTITTIIWTQRSSTGFYWLCHNWKWYFAVNRISSLTSTQRHHQKSARKPHETEKHSLLIIGGNKLVVLVGEIKMEVERRSLMIFFLVSGFRTHVVATLVCATGSVRTLSVARPFF